MTCDGTRAGQETDGFSKDLDKSPADQGKSKGGQASGMLRGGTGAGSTGGSKTKRGPGHTIREPEWPRDRFVWAKAGALPPCQGSGHVKGPGQRPPEKLSGAQHHSVPVETGLARAHSSVGREGSVTRSGLCCILHPQTQPALTGRLPAAGLGLGSGREGPLNPAVLRLVEQMCNPDATW